MRILCGILLLSYSLAAQAGVRAVHVTDSAAKIYRTIEGAKCGDTVTIEGGTYSVAKRNLPRIYVADRICSAEKPLTIQAADPAHKPLFDYTGSPLDDDKVQGSYDGGDFMRGAWQIVHSSYVTIDGLKIKGATAKTQSSVAGVRYVGTDHLTVRNTTFELNWNGLFGTGTNTLVENDTFLANGHPSEDQEHQFYDSGGDQLTLRYSYFNGDGCCMNSDGSISKSGGGQNFHSRSWHSHVYGNWFQDAPLYEWDMMTPDTKYCAGCKEMVMEFYGNVVVSSPAPHNDTKVMTFYGDAGGFASGTMRLDAEWNTFYLRYPAGAYVDRKVPPNTCCQYSLFQINNDPARLHSVEIHFANNVVHFVPNCPSCGYKRSLFVLAKTTGSWQITGSHNWFTASAINTCAQAVHTSSGSCLLTDSTADVSPPFVNIDELDLRPKSPDAFGMADTTQPLKPLYAQPSPGVLQKVTGYTERGALQSSAGEAEPGAKAARSCFIKDGPSMVLVANRAPWSLSSAWIKNGRHEKTMCSVAEFHSSKITAVQYAAHSPLGLEALDSPAAQGKAELIAK